MTLDIIPNSMFARHIKTGEWHILDRDFEADGWGLRPEECYYAGTDDRLVVANLEDYDEFEATP